MGSSCVTMRRLVAERGNISAANSLRLGVGVFARLVIEQTQHRVVQGWLASR